MSDIPERAPDRLTRAEAKFAEFLRMKAENLNVSFEVLCAKNPDDATALRVLYSIYDEGRSAAENPTLGSRLEKFFGATVVERTALESVASPPDDAAAPGGNPPREALPLGGHRREDGARYDMKEELARGGMGIILRVWDRDLNRQIAMKVLPPGARGSPAGALPEHLPRFLEEAQVTAQLDHPGIVPVHELGVDANGRLYFTMQLVKGGELKGIFELARAGKDGWNVPRAVGVVVKACQAVAYAHAKGVIHRDLKPANVMVGRFGEVYVMDWGLAKIVGKKSLIDLRPKHDSHGSLTTVHSSQRDDSGSGDAALVTMDGTIIGTPAYMAPEQAAGQVEEVDHRSDVYSLGAILYSLLAGHPPYMPPGVRISARTILARVLDGPPAPLHRVNPPPPAELVAVCEKAMARAKSERYPGALEMSEDLQAYLDGHVVKAYEGGPLAQLRKWVARNRSTAVAAGAAVLAIIAGLLSVVAIETRANRELREENDKVLRLSDVKRLKDYVEEADALWPCVPEKSAAMESWLKRAAELAQRIDLHRDSLRALERQGTKSGAGEGAWTFPTPEIEWQHDALKDLVAGLESFSNADPSIGAIASVRERLDLARTIESRSLTEHAREWDEAVRSIADASACPAYGGLRIEPQLGLVPLGRDARSGLWEFAHVSTGSAPERVPTGVIHRSAEMGLVFVLLPGGNFKMGAEPPSAGRKVGDPHCDPSARAHEGPVHEVALDPFFASKYEMTQGQWLRATRRNPSKFRPETGFSLLHPVELVSLAEARIVLARLGLELPSEAQWEYLARGGTTSVWWTGDAAKSLDHAANLADGSLEREAPGAYPTLRWLDDGHARHAPVGSYLPNPFGIHDTVGNVWEWVSDAGRYADPASPGKGERPSSSGTMSYIRGGSWTNLAESGRSANRFAYKGENRDSDLGVRPVMRLKVNSR